MEKEYYFKEGCFIQEWMNTENHGALSIARARVEVGQETKLHLLKNTVERYAIIGGVGQVTVATQSWQVGVGDVVVIESEQAQKIMNIGTEDLIFLAICSPRFQACNYVEITAE